MDKTQLAKALSTETSLKPEEAEKFLDAFSKVLSDYFKKGEKVVIAEFGSFYVKDDQSVQFNPSAKLKDQIN